jgi:hypothetical protein
MDPRTAISLLVMTSVVLSKENGDTCNECIINSDATSLLLEGITAPIRVSPESQRYLKKEAKTPAVTKEERQSRGINLLVTTSAAGEVIATIIMIKDDSFKKLEHIKVLLQS